MRDYVIITDSSCDLPADLAKELELEVIPLTVTVNGKIYTNYLDEREIPSPVFYNFLREKQPATTSAAHVQQFLNVMDSILSTGKDVLYLGFSSALSGTYSAGRIAADELRGKYPDRKIITVDTLCASLGQGLFVFKCAKLRSMGKDIDEVASWAEENRLSLCHWFTVDDLHHLKRGGRISAATAIIGTTLGIKPVMHVDNEGRLIAVGKVRGRKASIKALVEHMAETAIEPGKQDIFISHGDCVEDAKYLAELIKDRFNVKRVLINPVGPVIGAHSGPGTLALFFVGSKR